MTYIIQSHCFNNSYNIHDQKKLLKLSKLFFYRHPTHQCIIIQPLLKSPTICWKMRTISFRKRNQNHLTDKIFENNVLPSQTLSKTTPAIQPTSPSSYNVKRFKRYAKVLVLSMILSVNWIFLIPCEYEVDCLRNEAMAWGNIAHKSSVLVSMIQMQHPEQKVDLPWFIHWKFYKDKLFWNMLIQCDIQFTISYKLLWR